MKSFLKIIVSVLTVLYPILVFLLMVVLKMPIRVISLCVLTLALVFFLSATGERNKNGNKKFSFKPLLSSILLLALGITCFITNSSLFLKFYPIAVCVSLLFVFGVSIFSPPPIIFRFATLQDKSIIGSYNENRVKKYCLKVTLVWCAFFIINSLISLYTAIFCSEAVWSLYNGGISYIIMGLIFAVELIIRRIVNNRMPKLETITKFNAQSRQDDFIMCYNDIWSKKEYKTWLDFLTDCAKMRKYLSDKNATNWILHCNDYWYFLITFVALLQCKKEISLTANISPSFIKEMRKPNSEFLSDVDDAVGATNIIQILSSGISVSEDEIRFTPEINSEETKIYMFTSGSTGEPKSVLQRMTEFEMDNEFIFSKFGDEFLKRKLVSTVSQHHIYGFLFSISLPFAAGIPFRKKRVEFPSEFEKFTDTEYMIITVPAFLKRTNETEEKLLLKNPYIFTSGGVLLLEVAKKTNDVFGFWPMEVYGSTETSGIAYRQSKNGLEWTPFANAKIWKDDDGCLVIKSPYIKDPNGFKTADLVDILPDGRFLLKGRADSIVKIEEKRISLTEVENRIMQTGLVKEVCVVPMNDRRQYLASAIVFNEKGKAQFKDVKKLEINKYFQKYLLNFFENVVLPKRWRYLDALPTDTQGKKKRVEIQALFQKD